MKIEVFYARKLYNNKVDVWDSVIRYCKRLNRKLIVDYNGEKMLIENLDNYSCDGKSYMAQRTDKYMKAGDMYSLWSYYWAPVEQKHEEEGGVFEPTNTYHIRRMLQMKQELGFK